MNLRHFLTFASFLIASISTQSCGTKNKTRKTQGKKIEIVFSPHAKGFLLSPQKDTVMTLKVEIADENYERARGLMYRKSIEKDQSMLFVFEQEAPRSFWMKNTQMSLDLLFIDKNFKIVTIRKNCPPYSTENIRSEIPALYVLELQGGSVDRLKISEGFYFGFKKNN